MKKQKGNKNFFRLFFRRELIPLSGKNFSNLGVIVLLLFIAFSVIGFAEGSLRYLEQKMKDPFINWVTVLPAHGGYPTPRVLSELNTDAYRHEYSLLNALGYVRFQFNFYYYNEIENYYQTGELNDHNIYPVPGRTIDFNDPLIPEVFSKKNLITGYAFESPTDIGLVIREEMLQRLGYPLNTPYVWMDFLAYRSDDMTEIRVPIPVPVQAVVRSLPGLAGFATTPYFYQQRSPEFRGNPFNPIHDGRLVLSYHGDNISDFLKTAEDVFQQKQSAPNYSVSAVWQEKRYLPGDNEKYMVFVNFRPGEVPMQMLDEVFQGFYNHDAISAYKADLYRIYDYERRFTAPQEFHAFDRISLNFSALDQLRPFSVMLSEEYNLEVDMAQIESRENYNFVSRLTLIISLVLIGFSVLSILFFVSYLLKKHLAGIKRNLGTFKAFGLSNSFLINLYVQIVLAIIGLATIAALFLSAVFGYSGGMRLILMFFGSKFEPGNYFSLMSYYLLVALIILMIFSVWVLRAVSSKILKNTPGDLIYERE